MLICRHRGSRWQQTAVMASGCRYITGESVVCRRDSNDDSSHMPLPHGNSLLCVGVGLLSMLESRRYATRACMLAGLLLFRRCKDPEIVQCLLPVDAIIQGRMKVSFVVFFQWATSTGNGVVLLGKSKMTIFPDTDSSSAIKSGLVLLFSAGCKLTSTCRYSTLKRANYDMQDVASMRLRTPLIPK
jgi:hypothetical protein